MNHEGILDELARIVGGENLLTARRDLLVYEYDAANETRLPDAVVFATTTLQAAEVMGLAHREGIPLVVRGAGTNLSGGTVTLEGGIVLVLTRMDRVLSVDTPNERAEVGPGMVNLDLQNFLAPMGYLYAPDPSSQKVSSLGGNVGENAGGPHCLKYGITSNHVVGLEVVLADGRVIRTGGETEDCPGYDLTGLFVGSEGTMGAVTSIAIRLMRLPESLETMLAIFETLEDSGAAVAEIIAQGIIPATLEIMDQAIVQAVEDSQYRAGYPTDAGGVLLIEIDGIVDGLPRQSERISEICRRHGAREVRLARSDEERSLLWAGRRSAYAAMVRLASGCSVHDMTVPRTRLAEALKGAWEIAQRHGVKIGGAAHAGDGNLHPLVLYDPKDPEESSRAHQADREIVELCVRLGGTLTGEHGIGLEKRDYMPLLYGSDDLELMRLLKHTLDPSGMLNPGKVLPIENERAERHETAKPTA